LKHLKEILGGDFSQSVIKIVPSGKEVNTMDWHEITIEPKIGSPAKTLVIRVISRNPSIDAVKDIANKTEDTITEIVTKVLLKSKI
jgi:hypothetical protein